MLYFSVEAVFLYFSRELYKECYFYFFFDTAHVVLSSLSFCLFHAQFSTQQQAAPNQTTLGL